LGQASPFFWVKLKELGFQIFDRHTHALLGEIIPCVGREAWRVYS
jgi:hypothetical protein